MTAKMPRHILQLTREEKRKFINSFELVLADCDGVVWHLNEPIKDAGKGITLLQNAGKQVNFVTNNSLRGDSEFIKKFQNAGIKTNLENCIQPSKSIVYYLKKIEFTGLIYCIGAQLLKDMLKDAGFEVIDGPNTPIEESMRTLIEHVFEKQPVKAVVIDFDFNLTGIKLLKADQYLKQEDCILVVGATDLIVPVRKHGLFMGPGTFVKNLQDSSQKVARILGKPGKELGEIIIDKYAIKDPNRVLFIGDILEQDIGFGKMCGFQTLLVLTGGTSKEDLIKNVNHELEPDFYADQLSDFIEFFSSLE